MCNGSESVKEQWKNLEIDQYFIQSYDKSLVAYLPLYSILLVISSDHICKWFRLKPISQLRFDYDTTTTRLRRKIDMFIFARVESRRMEAGERDTS